MAFSILHFPEGSQERREGIRKAALTPSLYKELREQYPDGAASDDTLKSTLLRRGFNPSVLDDVISDYRSTMELVAPTDVSYTAPTEQNKMNSNTQTTIAGNQSYSFALGPTTRAGLTISGDVTPEELELLRDHIELTIKALTRSAAKEAKKK